jgi:hypothetical protein
VSGSDVVELRRYVLHPGRRDALIDIFDAHFLEGQESTGMTVLGQFRDLDRPDVFVWLRGFADMRSRAESLAAFYGGPVWAAHRDAANATMAAWDDVRLLRPVSPGRGLRVGDRAPTGSAAAGLLVATVYTLPPESAADFPRFFAAHVEPRLAMHGVTPLGVFEQELSANTYPGLPIREGEHAFVWFARFDDAAAHQRFADDLAEDAALASDLRLRLASDPERWRLEPTARSRQLGPGPREGQARPA